jgi:hypothetical protein
MGGARGVAGGTGGLGGSFEPRSRARYRTSSRNTLDRPRLTYLDVARDLVVPLGRSVHHHAQRAGVLHEYLHKLSTNDDCRWSICHETRSAHEIKAVCPGGE